MRLAGRAFAESHLRAVGWSENPGGQVVFNEVGII